MAADVRACGWPWRLLTEPEPEEKLVEFYRRARPMGCLGTDRQRRPACRTGRLVTDRRADLASRPWAPSMVGAGIIAMSFAYVARWDVAAVALVVSLLAGLVFRRYFIPFVREFERP